MRFSLCVLATLLGTAVIQAAPVAKPVAAPVVAEPLAEKDGLIISISATTSNDPWMDGDVLTRNIQLNVSAAFVDVVIANISDKPIRIFKESNSWGYRNLVLEVVKIDNQILPKPTTVVREPGTWFSNAPISEIIEPGTAVVRRMQLLVPDIYPDAKPKSWRPMYFYDSFPFPDPATPKLITMRAVFFNKFAFGSEKEPVWNGTIASKPLEYRVTLTDDRYKTKPQ